MDLNPTQAEVDAVARQLLATVEEPPRRITIGGKPVLFMKAESCYGTQPDLSAESVLKARHDLLLNGGWVAGLFDEAYRKRADRMRTYPTGCTCPKMKIGDPPQTYDPACPIAGHRRLAG